MKMRPPTRMKRTTSSRPARHPTHRITHLICGALLVCILLLAAFPAPSAPVPGADDPKKTKPADDFLIFGTVFTEQGFGLQGAKIAVRLAGEKKVRGRAISDRRGEFGVRVPAGAEYEVTIEARGFTKAGRKVDAKTGQRLDFVARLQMAGKAAAKDAAGEKKP